MQTYLTDLLARERIADLRRDAHRDRLAARTRAWRWSRQGRGRACEA